VGLVAAQKVGSAMEFLASKIYYLWATIAGLGAIVFSAGMLVEKIRTDKYVTKEVHSADLKTIDTKFDLIQVQLTGVQSSLNKVTEWIDRVRD